MTRIRNSDNDNDNDNYNNTLLYVYTNVLELNMIFNSSDLFGGPELGFVTVSHTIHIITTMIMILLIMPYL